MYQDLNAPISVVAIFRNGKLLPHSFVWRDRTYLVQSVSFEHQQSQGKARVLIFSVNTKNNMYEISFNTEQMLWRLERAWTE